MGLVDRVIEELWTEVHNCTGGSDLNQPKEKEMQEGEIVVWGSFTNSWFERKEVKLSLFADDVILYIENPKDFTIKLLELINEYNKVARYKINTQKSFVVLYTNNDKTEREIKETIPFTTAMKRIIY